VVPAEVLRQERQERPLVVPAHVEEFDTPSADRRGEHEPARVKGDRGAVAATLEAHDALAIRRAQVPQPRRVIHRSRREDVLLWAHLQSHHPVGVRAVRAQVSVVVQRHVAHGVIHRRSDNNGERVVREARERRAMRVALGNALQLALSRGIQANAVVVARAEQTLAVFRKVQGVHGRRVLREDASHAEPRALVASGWHLRAAASSVGLSHHRTWRFLCCFFCAFSDCPIWQA
jgi:hypothetical protein